MKSQGPMTIAKNSVANLLRFAVSVLAAALLPPFLTRRLSHDMYAAWVLILQLGAYAAIFELGLQAAISKFVAQHHATQDHAGTSSVVSTATALLTASAALALTAVGILVWQVPHLFGQLTPPLVHQVRLGILLIGGATALALPTTALASSFQGVQRYNVPMIIGGGSQLLSTLAIIIAVFYHSSLIVMGACVAAITLAAGLVQVGAWRRYLAHVRITVSGVTRRMTRTIFNYCAAMSVSSFAMLLISGLDTVIVGHFNFKQTGFYAVAASLTNFVILTAGNVFSPLLPADFRVSALATPRHCLPDVALYPFLRRPAGFNQPAAAALRATHPFTLGRGRLRPQQHPVPGNPHHRQHDPLSMLPYFSSCRKWTAALRMGRRHRRSRRQFDLSIALGYALELSVWPWEP